MSAGSTPCGKGQTRRGFLRAAAAGAASPVRFVGLGHGDAGRIERLVELLGLVPAGAAPINSGV